MLANYIKFFGLVIYLENADWELEPPSLVPELAARLIFSEPEPPMERRDLLVEFDAPDDVVAERPVEDTPRARARDSEPPRTSVPGLRVAA